MSAKFLVIHDKKSPLVQMVFDSTVQLISAQDFLKKPKDITEKNIKIINLCNDMEYLGIGYYASLMAEARGQRCIPSVNDILNLNWKRMYISYIEELEHYLHKNADLPFDGDIAKTIPIIFGRVLNPELAGFGRRVFDLFRFPVLEARLRYTDKWHIEEIVPLPINDLPAPIMPFFEESFKKFTGITWKNTRNSEKFKYWLAILYNPKDPLGPSDLKTLEKFEKAGKKLGIATEIIDKGDLASLLEYDALFIRETTAVDNHTFRFATKALREGMPCIDDRDSIIKCCNKIFLKELLETNHLPHPKTAIYDKSGLLKAQQELSYPLVVKIPDSSFSMGVFKVNSHDELVKKTSKIFQKTDLILVQEFIPTEYDWRIGVLNNEPLYANKYYMAKGHWQIYNHGNGSSKKIMNGKDEAIPLEDVPPDILELALKTAKLTGNGLYGIDLKMTDKGPVIIEINDNPSIITGIEDAVAGDALYTKIMQRFLEMLETPKLIDNKNTEKMSEKARTVSR